MSQQTRWDRHLGLVTRMAEALGADLEAAAYAGDLPPEALDAMVVRCAGCSDPSGCERALGAPGTRLDAAPSQCRNAAELLAFRIE